jgi:hypothetical protein
MNNIIHKLFVDLGVRSDKLKRGFKDAERHTMGFSSTIKDIGKIVAGAFTVSKIVGFGKEAARLAGEMQGVKNAFDNLNAPGLLSNLRQATRGTVSDLELMKAAVRADNFRIPLTEMGKLLEFAHKRALQTGESVEYLVNSIVLGIGRKSPLILDNLGISAIELRKKLKGVGIEAASIGDVTKIVGEIADRELEKMGDQATTSKEKTEALKASWENFLAYIGNAGIPIIDKVKVALTNLLDSVSYSFDDNFSGMVDGMVGNFARSIKDLNGEARKLAIEGEIKRQTEATQEFYNTHKRAINRYKDFLDRGVDLWNIMNKDYKQIITTNNAMNEYLSVLNDVNDGTADLTELTKKENKEQEKKIGIIENLKNEIKSLKEQIDTATSRENIISLQVKLKSKEGKLEELMGLGELKDLEFTPKTKSQTEGFEKDLEKSMDYYDEYIDEITDKYDNQFTNSINKFYDNHAKRIDGAIEKTEEMSDATQKISDTFINSFSQASDSAESFKNNVLSAVRSTIKAYVAESIAATVKNALASTPPPFNLIIAAAAGAAAGTLLNSIIPSFASEGSVNRPTMAMVGDYPNAQTNPEFMLKQSTLKKLMDSNGTSVGSFVLRGSDLYLSVTRASDKLSSRGINTRI